MANILDLAEERDELRAQLEKVTEERDAVLAELSACLAAPAFADEHASYEFAKAAEQRGTDDGAIKLYEGFLEHYPKSDMAPKARGRLAGLRKKAQAHVEASQLADVTSAEIYANERKYKGQTIVRQLDCGPPESADAALGDHQTKCTMDTKRDTRVLYWESDLKKLASLPREESGRFSYRGVFKILGNEPYGNGIVLKFLDRAD